MANRRRKTKRKTGRPAIKVIYAIIGFFALGYFPALLLRERFGPQASMVAAAAAIIPLGSRAKSLVRALAVGTGLGMLAGYAMCMALIERHAIPPDRLLRMTMVYTLATALLCAVIAAAFAHLAANRRRRMEDQW